MNDYSRTGLFYGIFYKKIDKNLQGSYLMSIFCLAVNFFFLEKVV